MRRVHGFLGFVICLLTVLGFSNRTHAQGIRKVNATIPALTESSAIFFIAREMGYWSEEGLDVDLIVVRAAPSIQAVIAGNVDFSTAGGSALLPILRGLPLSFLFTTFNRPHFSLYAKQSISSIQELNEKRVGISSIGSGPDSLLRDLLKRQGMEGGRDVTIMAVGTGIERFVALKMGTVDAAMLSPSEHHLAEEAGFRELFSFVKQSDAVYLQGAVVTTEQRLRTDPIFVEKFIRGSLRGLLYLRDNRSGSAAILSRVLRIKVETMARIYDGIRPGITIDGTVDEEQQRKSFAPLLERVGSKGPPPLDKIFNFSITKKVYAELTGKKGKTLP